MATPSIPHKSSPSESSTSSSDSDSNYSLPEDLKQQLLTEHGPDKIVCSEIFNKIWNVPVGRNNFGNAENFTNCINLSIKKKNSTDNWEFGKKSNEDDTNLQETPNNLAKSLDTKVKTPESPEKSNTKSPEKTNQQPKKIFDLNRSLDLPTTMMSNKNEPGLYHDKYHIVDSLTNVENSDSSSSNNGTQINSNLSRSEDIVKKGIEKFLLNVPEWNISNSNMKPRRQFRQIVKFLIQSRLNSILNANMSFGQDLGPFGNIYEMETFQKRLNSLTRLASLDLRRTLAKFFENYKFIVILTVYDIISKEPTFVSQCYWDQLNDEKVFVYHFGDYFCGSVQVYAIQF
jgi:hypothetical protein